MAVEPIESVCEALHTVRDFVRWGASEFGRAGLVFGHGTDNALDEACSLVLHALQLPRGMPDVYLAATLTREERLRAVKLLRRRVEERKPAPYLVGEAWFAGLPFHVDERVLVPRSPVAELIEDGFAPFVVVEDVHRLLDVGTGSGCIAVACALAFADARVDAVDVSDGALQVARSNVTRHGLDARVRCLRSNLFERLEGERYDIIVSNPPYVDAREMQALPDEYRHEPVLALAGGNDGLDLVRALLAEAAGHLNEDGIIVVEVGNSEAALQRAFPDVPFLWLELERGGHGVFMLTAHQVHEHADAFRA